MSQVRPYHLLGNSAVEKMRAAVDLTLNTWKEQWCSEQVAPEFSLREVNADDSELRDDDWLAYEAGNHRLYLKFTESRLYNFADVLAGNSLSAKNHAIIELVSKRALAALASQIQSTIFGTPNSTLSPTPNAPPPTLFRHGSGTVLFTLIFPGLKLIGLLQAPASSPRLKNSTTRLAHRKDCLGAQNVSMHAALALGKLTLKELQALQVGDVLKTTTPLSATFSLELKNHGTISECSLGRIDDKRCIRLPT